MEICANCAAKLDPSWKFCITCGTPVPAGAAHRTRDEPIAAEAAAPEDEIVEDEVVEDEVVEFETAEDEVVEFETAEPETDEFEVDEDDADEPAYTDDEDDLVAEQVIEEASEPTPVVRQDAPPKRAPRRARSQFAPPTPAAAEDEPADDDLDDEEPIAREPVLPVPVIPSPDASAPTTTDESDVESEPALEPVPEFEHALAHSPAPSINDLARAPFVEENPFTHDLPPRPEQPQSRAEAKAAAAERAAIRARNTAAAKAEIRAKYPIPAASAKNQEYTEESIPSFRTADGAPLRRRIDVPLVVSISLSTAGVVLIVYLAILVFGARG